MLTTSLRQILTQAQKIGGYSMPDLTVLSNQVDPYRLDTPTHRKNGAWFAHHFNRFLTMGDAIHLRGFHYILVAAGDVMKPDGKHYKNTFDDWNWMSTKAAKAARFLGYVAFERITDERNTEPVIFSSDISDCGTPYVDLGADIRIVLPDLDEIKPRVCLSGFHAAQPYRLAIYGEKTSLAKVLTPICRSKRIDLYLPSGEISDTQLYCMAKTGADDSRPTILFTMTDFDPWGNNMSVSIGRKLQAFKDCMFPDFEFQVLPIALNAEQVRELGLPNEPLKAPKPGSKDRLANIRKAWHDRWNLGQTEIDALASLRPDILRQIVEDAIAPYYDRTLSRRAADIELEWDEVAEDILRRQVDDDLIASLYAQAEARVAVLQPELDAINEQLRSMASDVGVSLAAPTPPQPELDPASQRKPLVSSAWDWIAQTLALKAWKALDDAEPAVA